ncbi:MAG: hypothetical protein OXF88_14370 [Rhodobacteraceae bacterium]|nr:hypothetical protein [Paracoccaceae bacterium]
MKARFDPAEFVMRIGRDLVQAFDNAREATTPELVGDAMEQPVRDHLEQILPREIAVGSGCVIDSSGSTSRQMDVVLYERGLCPVFCINDSPETTYYPAECVLAVGEIKSTIGKRELADSFEKIRSVKALHRAYTRRESGVYVGRRYGDLGSASAHGFYRDHTNKGDIFGFVLADKPAIAVTLPDPSKTHRSAPKATLLGHYVENIGKLTNDVLCPDLVVFLDGTVLIPQVVSSSQSFVPYTPARTQSVLPHLIHPMRADSPFGELIKHLWKRHQNGLTAHIPLEHYLHHDAKTDPNLTWAVIANVGLPEELGLKPGDPFKVETPTDHLRDDLEQLARKTA